MRIKNSVTAHGNVPQSVIGFHLGKCERLGKNTILHILTYARSVGDGKVVQGRPNKLPPTEPLREFVVYCRRKTRVRYETNSWKYPRTSFSREVLFIGSVVNKALEDDVMWLGAKRLAVLWHNFP